MQRGPGARGGGGGHIIAGGGGPVGTAVHRPILRIPFFYHLPSSAAVMEGEGGEKRNRWKDEGKRKKVGRREEEEAPPNIPFR